MSGSTCLHALYMDNLTCKFFVIAIFTWGHWEKLRQTPIRTVLVWIEIWTGYLPYTKQECYPACLYWVRHRRELHGVIRSLFEVKRTRVHWLWQPQAPLIIPRAVSCHTHRQTHTHSDCECWFRPQFLLHKPYRALNKWRHGTTSQEPSLSTNQHQRSPLSVFHS